MTMNLAPNLIETAEGVGLANGEGLSEGGQFLTIIFSQFFYMVSLYWWLLPCAFLLILLAVIVMPKGHPTNCTGPR